MKLACAVSCVVLISAPVLAQQQSAAKRPATAPHIVTGPAEIFGIRLGAPLSLPACSAHYAADGRPACVTKTTSFHFDPAYADYQVTLDNLDLTMLTWKVGLSTYRGEVVEIHVGTSGFQNEEVALANLAGKFGTPTEVSHHQVQNLYGAIFDVGHASWRFSDGSQVTYASDIGPLGEGDIIGVSKTEQDLQAARDREGQKDRMQF